MSHSMSSSKTSPFPRHSDLLQIRVVHLQHSVRGELLNFVKRVHLEHVMEKG